MRKRSLRFCFGLIAVLVGITADIQQAKAIDIGAFAGGSYPLVGGQSAAGASLTSTGVITPTFGAFVGIDFIPFVLGVDIGATFDRRAFSSSNVTSQFSQMQFPIIARLKLLPVIAPGVGVNFGFPVGDYSVGSTVSTLTAAGIASFNFDLVFSLRVEFPVIPLIKLFVDARYVAGLTDYDTSAATLKTGAIQGLAGIKFGF